MKKAIIYTFISILILVVFSLVTSLIISYLVYNKGMQINGNILRGVSIIFFLLCGLIFGLLIKKQGLKYSLLFVIIYFIFQIIFNTIIVDKNLNMSIFLIMLAKIISYMTGSIIGVNIIKN